MVVEISSFSGREKMRKYVVKQLLEAYKEENHVTIRWKIWSSFCVNDAGQRKLLADSLERPHTKIER